MKRIRLALCTLALAGVATGSGYGVAAGDPAFCDDHCTRIYIQCINRGFSHDYCQYRYEKCWYDCIG